MRAGRFREMNQEKVKADIAEAKKKKEQEKKDKEREGREARKAARETAAKGLAEHTIKVQEELKER